MGLSLQSYHTIYGTSAAVSVLLSAVHAILSLYTGSSRQVFSISNSSDSASLYGLIVRPYAQNSAILLIVAWKGVCLLATLLLTSSKIFRRLPYELFLRGYQVGAAVVAFALWNHIGASFTFPQIYLYIGGGLFAVTAVIETLMVLYRNFSFRAHFCRAFITEYRANFRVPDRDDVYKNHSTNTLRISVIVPRTWKVEAGHYVNIWLPGGSFRSCFESHPFIIALWSIKDYKTMELKLLVKPRKGFTRRLKMSTIDSREDRRLLVFSGPYGLSHSVKDFGSILMIASGFGIVSHLPYIKAILEGYMTSRVITRRIHLVWEVKSIGKFSRSPFIKADNND